MVRILLYSQLGAGRASSGSRGTLAAMQGWLSAAYEIGVLPTAYPEGVFAETLVRWDRETAAEHADRAWRAIETGRDLPPASPGLTKLANYEAILGRLDTALELADEAIALADAAGYSVASADAVATAARITAVLTAHEAAPVLADALESARATRWWFNVWPVLSGAGRWFQAQGNARTAAVVDGYFEARGRSRDVNDLVPAPASDPTTFVDDRRAGAAMSADEIVDHVLDELRSADRTATMH